LEIEDSESDILKDNESPFEKNSVSSTNKIKNPEFHNCEFGNWPWKENNIKVFLNKRKREVRLGIETGGIRSKLFFKFEKQN
jgi:hypothetical protein